MMKKNTYLIFYPTIEEEWEYHHIQATLPYLKKEWIIQITELSKMNGFNK